MSTPPGMLDYFALEAGDCLARVEAWVRAAERPDAVALPDGGDAAQAMRAFHGAAVMARETEFAVLGAAGERVIARLVAGDAAGTPAAALDALTAAVDGARTLLRAPRPLDSTDATHLARLVEALDEAAGGGDAGAATAAASPAAVLPMRALAADGDAGFLVRRAANPPQTAGSRFRSASAPLAQALRRLVGEARGLPAPNGNPADRDAATATVGADLAAALDDLRALAESYDIQPAVAFCTNRRDAAEALDPRTLAAVDAAAAGLLGEAAVAEPAAVDAPEPAPPAPAEEAGFRPPTGEALVALLATGISGLERFDGEREAEEAPAPNGDGPAAPDRVPAGAPNGAPAAAGVVPIETLLYRGRAALDRAREVRDLLRARPGAPDPARLAELYDLLDLAAQP